MHVVRLFPQALLQVVQSHDGSVRSVVEKGDALLSSVHYPSIRDKMNRLQRDYTELCKRAMVRTCAEVSAVLIYVNNLLMQASKYMIPHLLFNCLCVCFYDKGPC